jgi:hypothetical protein
MNAVHPAYILSILSKISCHNLPPQGVFVNKEGEGYDERISGCAL